MINIRSLVEQHSASVVEKEAARKAVEEKQRSDEMTLVRIHADNIERCLLTLVKPVLAECAKHLEGHYSATVKTGNSNDPMLQGKQTVVEIDIEVGGKRPRRHHGGGGSKYRLEYTGDVDRGTITGIENLDGIPSFLYDSHQVPVKDVTTEQIEGHLEQFVVNFLKQEDSGSAI